MMTAYTGDGACITHVEAQTFFCPPVRCSTVQDLWVGREIILLPQTVVMSLLLDQTHFVIALTARTSQH